MSALFDAFDELDRLRKQIDELRQRALNAEYAQKHLEKELAETKYELSQFLIKKYFNTLTIVYK